MHTHRSFSSRTLPGLLTALLLVAVPLACHKPAKPSEEYTQAHTRFGKLYAEKGDESFLDPQMDQVEALLARVPPDSLDVVAANELRSRIQAGKAQAIAQQKARDAALASARTPSAPPSGFNTPLPSAPSRPPPDSAPADAGTDAGSGAGRPEVGTPVSQLANGFNGCFQQGESLNVQGHGLRDRWELADRAECRQRYGSLQDQVLLIEDDKVLGMAPRASIQRVGADGGAPSGDGGS